MKSSTELKELLRQIDHKGYPAYKETKGAYQFGTYVLSIDHVQGDPFATPSRVSIHVPGRAAGFPKPLYDTGEKRVALQDCLLRRFGRLAEAVSRSAGSGKSGMLGVSRCGQEILERSACQIEPDQGDVVLRMEVGFPANGRTINARALEKIFFEELPDCVKGALYCQAYKKEVLQQVADLAEDQQYIREQLRVRGLTAFIANGAVLPRESGVSRHPMKGAVPFVSPSSLEVEMNLPHKGKILGMGIPRGVTVIVGGGYHGKSTLLKAIESGVYNHIRGDGREYVITDHTAMKIRAEDGRSIRQVDISMFINHLPNQKDTCSFYTEDASGSTSQAANMVEAMEAGTSVFLIDEDTSATNFMIRDELMQQVVSPEAEPITPFVDRVRELYERFGISTILVAGSSGSYFYKADHILQMDCYRPADITDFAKEKAAAYALNREAVNLPIIEKAVMPNVCRCPLGSRRSEKRGGDSHRIKIKTTGKDSIFLDKEVIDMRYVEQLADHEQLITLGYLLHYAQEHCFDGKKSMQEIVEKLDHILVKQGFQVICEGSYLPVNFALPRKQEIFACLNRYRGLLFAGKEIH